MNHLLFNEDRILHYVARLILDEDLDSLEEVRGKDWELDEHIRVAKHGHYLPITIALAHEKFKVVEYLLSLGVDLNRAGYAALPTGASHLSVEWLGKLIENGADVNSTNTVRNTAFDIAFGCDRLDVCEFLISQGFQVTQNQYKCLRQAVSFKQDIKLVKKLIDWGVDIISAPADNVFTSAASALQLAVQKGNIEMVEFLLSNGADVNVKDDFGTTPRLAALKHGFTELAERLQSLEGREGGFTKEQLLSTGVDPQLIEFIVSENRTIEFENDGVAKIEFYSMTDLYEHEFLNHRFIDLTLTSQNALFCGPLVWFVERKNFGFVDYEHYELSDLCDWSVFITDPRRALDDMQCFFCGI